MTAPRTVDVARLRDTFSGDIVLPADDEYASARKVWNGMIDRRPALVARPASVADVVAAVRFGREHDLVIAIRGGGHSMAGYSTCDDGLVIDLSNMRGVTVDPVARTARANGGALLRELDEAAQHHGLVCPVGVVGHTGVGGLTLGGGMGRLQRRFGLTIDNLRSVEVVTADGRHVTASATENPGLFWAMRGAGANFGVATAFEFDLHPFGPTITRGLHVHPLDRIHDLWPMFREFCATAPVELHLAMSFGLALPAADFPPSIAGGPIVTIGFNHPGDPDAAARDTAPLTAAGEPAVLTIAELPYLAVQTMFDEASGWGHRVYTKGSFANDLPAGAWDELVEHMTRSSSEDSFAFWAQGGAMANASDDDTAFTGRSALFDVSAESAWDDPADDEAHIAWVRRAMAIVEPYATVGRYVNEAADSGESVVRSIYGNPKYERLVAAKREWDPDNVFRLNQNIKP